MSRLNRWLAEFPSTQARVAFTLLFVAATTIRYLAFGVPYRLAAGNIPVVDGWGYWLLFLAGMSGLDVGAFAAKRFSDVDYATAKNANNQPTVNVGGPASVDVNASPVAPPPGPPPPPRPTSDPVTAGPPKLPQGEAGE